MPFVRRLVVWNWCCAIWSWSGDLIDLWWLVFWRLVLRLLVFLEVGIEVVGILAVDIEVVDILSAWY